MVHCYKCYILRATRLGFRVVFQSRDIGRQTRATAKEEHFLQWGPSEAEMLHVLSTAVLLLMHICLVKWYW